jgi:hypothetical protein
LIPKGVVMDSRALAFDVLQIQRRLQSECLPRARDQFERNAVRSIDQKLAEIVRHFRSGELPTREKRFGEVARMVEEIDPNVIPAEIGKELMRVECFYREL